MERSGSQEKKKTHTHKQSNPSTIRKACFVPNESPLESREAGVGWGQSKRMEGDCC